MTKTVTMEVYQLTATTVQEGGTPTPKVRGFLRAVADASGMMPAAGQDTLDFTPGSEPAIGTRYTADTTYTEVVE